MQALLFYMIDISNDGSFDELLREIKSQYTSEQDRRDIEAFFINSCNRVENAYAIYLRMQYYYRYVRVKCALN